MRTCTFVTDQATKAAAILNNAFSTSSPIGDGAALCSSAHPSLSGNQRNQLATAADLNETSLEQMLIDIAGLTDERGLKIAVRGMKLIIPKELQFIAERVINPNLRSGTADNDLNAMKSMGMLPDGAVVNHFLTDTDAFFIKTDAPNGFKMFQRTPLKTAMEGDFDTGNMRFKARERYSFGVSDWRSVFGSPEPNSTQVTKYAQLPPFLFRHTQISSDSLILKLTQPKTGD